MTHQEYLLPKSKISWRPCCSFTGLMLGAPSAHPKQYLFCRRQNSIKRPVSGHRLKWPGSKVTTSAQVYSHQQGHSLTNVVQVLSYCFASHQVTKVVSQMSVGTVEAQKRRLWASFLPQDTFTHSWNLSAQRPNKQTLQMQGFLQGRSYGFCVWRLQAWNQGVPRVGFWWGRFFSNANGCFPAVHLNGEESFAVFSSL